MAGKREKREKREGSTISFQLLNVAVVLWLAGAFWLAAVQPVASHAQPAHGGIAGFYGESGDGGVLVEHEGSSHSLVERALAEASGVTPVTVWREGVEEGSDESEEVEQGRAAHEGVQIARLGDDADAESFQAIRDAFVRRNPGYDLNYLPSVLQLDAERSFRVLFVQEGEGSATIHPPDGEARESEVIVGDIILLNEGERMTNSTELSLLEIWVPDQPAEELPPFIRPDWDPLITDTPGGCATEMDAYRRILLTWSEDVGNYLFHSLNAHRVRIRDSFSHYHPVDTGFDEFYLVQLTEPGARIITSEQTDRIVDPGSVERSETESLMREYDLEVGDLVYLPRGVVHRGVGGVVAQVITVPGFIPGNEIGVDHHLRRINERLELSEDEALPYNLEASEGPVIR